MNRMAGYIRVSTGDQGLSVEAQKQRIVEYCTFNKYELVETFVDEDISGSTEIYSRPSGRILCNVINAKSVDGVISVKLDRMFRNASDALSCCEIWGSKNVSMHLVDMGGMSMNTDTAIGKMMLTMLAGFAEFERNMISERTKAVLTHKKNNNEVYGPIPYGFTQEAGKLLIDEAKMKIVQDIFKLQQMFSFEKIATKLNNEKVTAPKGGELWAKSTVFRIFKNSIYKNHVVAN